MKITSFDSVWVSGGMSSDICFGVCERGSLMDVWWMLVHLFSVGGENKVGVDWEIDG